MKVILRKKIVTIRYILVTLLLSLANKARSQESDSTFSKKLSFHTQTTVISQ